jgi:hypothetical protein
VLATKVCSSLICIAREYSETEDLELNQGSPDEINGIEGVQDGLSDGEGVDDDSIDESSDTDHYIGEIAGDWNDDDEASW